MNIVNESFKDREIDVLEKEINTNKNFCLKDKFF